MLTSTRTFAQTEDGLRRSSKKPKTKGYALVLGFPFQILLNLLVLHD